MLPCRTMWNNIIWLMIYQKKSAPNAVSNAFTLQKHTRWWSRPFYPWGTWVERGCSLHRNIPGGDHVHSIYEGPWLREVQRCGRHCGCPLLPINIYHPWAPPHFQVPASRLSPWRLGFLWQTSSLCLHARQASNTRGSLPLSWQWEPAASCLSSPTPLAR